MGRKFGVIHDWDDRYGRHRARRGVLYAAAALLEGCIILALSVF